MKSILALLLPCVLLAGEPLPPCCRSTLSPNPPSDKSLYQLDSKWTSDVGREIKLGVLRGRPQIVAMFFTHCEYACPILISELKSIEKRIPADLLGKIDFVLVSIDTKRDVPAELANFRNKNHLERKRWTLLHGQADDVRELAALLGVNYAEDSRGQFTHSNIITLLNAEGEVTSQIIGLKQDPSLFIGAIEKATWNGQR
jgi:protein SCO1